MVKKKFIKVSTKQLIPYENNPRINDPAVADVVESIKQCENLDPIEIDEDFVILSGHTRLLALEQLGIIETDVVQYTGLTDEQKRKYRILANKTNELAEWDFDKLEQELADLDMSGFTFGDELSEGADSAELSEDDYEPDLPEEPRAKVGDLYQLGNHRLICGDSTDAAVIDRLMDGQKADLFLTDPPYNVNYTDGHENERKIMNDNFASDEECGEKLWLPAFKNALQNSNDCCSVYCFMPQGGTHMMMMMMMMAQAGWQVKHELIWLKQSIVLNRADYNYQHEPFLYGWNKTHKFYGNGKFKNTSVWEIDRPTKSKEHPTMKPIELLGEILLNATQSGDNVLDCFGGSGSTLIACEQLNRKCYMCELDPHYVDVIVDRWEKLTGEKAVLLNG